MRLSALAAGLVAYAAHHGLAQTAKEGVPSTPRPVQSIPFPTDDIFSTATHLPIPTPARDIDPVGRFNFFFEGLNDPAFPRVLVATGKGQRLNFGLAQPGDVAVVMVELWNGKNKVFASGEPPARTTDGKQQQDKRQSGELAALNVTRTAVEFNIDVLQRAWSDNFNAAIYAKVSWHTTGEKGSTTTKPFIIARDVDAMGPAQVQLQFQQGGLPPATEVFVSTSASTTSSPGAGPSQSSSSGEPVSAQPSGGGLAPGVIAGIAIGGAAVLAIVGVLVWFFCFRRRKQHGQVRSAEYGHDAGTHAMMVDKEAPGVSTSSPHSAYGDDGGRLHDRSSAAMDSSYAPYSDHGPTSHANPAVAQPMPVHATPVAQPSLPRGTDSPTPSQPATTQYAHLVEEGMTADEIQRLEEEERALDQAIEAAGTNRPGR